MAKDELQKQGINPDTIDFEDSFFNATFDTEERASDTDFVANEEDFAESSIEPVSNCDNLAKIKVVFFLKGDALIEKIRDENVKKIGENVQKIVKKNVEKNLEENGEKNGEKNVEKRDKMEIGESSDDNASEKIVCEAERNSPFLCLTQDGKATTGDDNDKK